MNADDKTVGDLRGAKVLILTGFWAGHEGVCLGKTADGHGYAVSPHESDQILQLVLGQDFGLLMNLSGEPGLN